jgi:hypothetical protein
VVSHAPEVVQDLVRRVTTPVVAPEPVLERISGVPIVQSVAVTIDVDGHLSPIEQEPTEYLPDDRDPIQERREPVLHHLISCPSFFREDVLNLSEQLAGVSVIPERL